jgi:hypothetical protein
VVAVVLFHDDEHVAQAGRFGGLGLRGLARADAEQHAAEQREARRDQAGTRDAAEPPCPVPNPSAVHRVPPRGECSAGVKQTWLNGK